MKAKHEFRGYQPDIKTFEGEVKKANPQLDEQSVKELAKQEAQKYLPYCSATIACFKQDKDWVEPFGYQFFNPKNAQIDTHTISPTLEAKEDCFFDPYMGIKAVVLQNDQEVILCFGSLESGNYEFRLSDGAPQEAKESSNQAKVEIDEKKAASVRNNQMATVYANELGLRSKVYDSAELLYKKIASMPEFKEKKLLWLGSVLGGL